MSVDDKQMPFEKGVRFYPCPPGKRIMYDVSQLSGGEKTIAALTLLFALTMVKQPPMILLDEVDAFLDN
jgi:structural maintenance of chromosome 1